MLRRWGLGLALSAILHALALGGVMALAFVHAGGAPVDIEITGMSIDEVKDLPLGAPPSAARAGPARRAPRARAPRAPEEGGTLASRAENAPPRPGLADDQADDAEEAPARISDLRQLGPDGSRVTILLRVDRLKETPFAPTVDKLLVRLPDRRDLLDGTGLDLYDTVSALLISTPNLRDPAVTFLAARHRLSDGDLRGALDRGARATGRTMSWRTERGRPFAERHGRPGASGSRDERIVVMPAPGLVVVTPPVYRALLLAPPPPRPAVAARDPDGGATAGADGGSATAVGEAQPPSWRALLRRIDAEDGVLPPTGIAMVSAVDVFKPASPSARDTAMFWGMEVPRAITAVLGADPSPFVDITGEFAAESEARHWEERWPELKSRVRSHPYVLLFGFSGLVSRAQLSREGRVIHVHETATTAEAMQLLELATRLLGG